MRDAAQKTDKNVNTQLILALRRDLSSGHEPRDRQKQRQDSASWHHVCCLILLSHIFLPTTPPSGHFFLCRPILQSSCRAGCCYLDDPGNCLQLLGLIGIGYMLCMESRRHQAGITSMSMGLKHRDWHFRIYRLSCKVWFLLMLDFEPLACRSLTLWPSDSLRLSATY